MTNIFYVYSYINPTNGDPFYIGKGKEDRYLGNITLAKKKQHYNLYLQNKLWTLWDAGLEPIIKINEENLSEYDALELEKRLIVKYGRKRYDENGILCNLTLGGEGVVGHPRYPTPEEIARRSAKVKGRKMTPEQCKKISMAKKGKPSSFKGKTLSDEAKAKISAANRGRIKSPAECKQLSEARLGKKRAPHTEKSKKLIADKAHSRSKWSHNYLVTYPDGKTEIIAGIWPLFDRGYPRNTIRLLATNLGIAAKQGVCKGIKLEIISVTN